MSDQAYECLECGWSWPYECTCRDGGWRRRVGSAPTRRERSALVWAAVVAAIRAVVAADGKR